MKRQLLLALALFLVPNIAAAHVKWFVETEAIIEQETFHYSLTEPRVIIWIVVVLALIAVATFLELKWPAKQQRSRKKWTTVLVRLFQVIIGAWLILTAYHGSVLVPTLQADTPFTAALQYLEYVVGALLIIGYAAPLTSVLLIGIYVGASIHFGWLVLLEHFFIVGIGLAYALAQSTPSQMHHRFAEWATPLLRITTGASLVLLGFQEKLLHPELSLAFLNTHEWNFMQLVGFSQFSNELFVLSSGASEVLIGIIYILGVSTKLNTLALGVFLTATAIALGPTELIGHMPILAVALVFLWYGNGGRLVFSNLIKRWF